MPDARIKVIAENLTSAVMEQVRAELDKTGSAGAQANKKISDSLKESTGSMGGMLGMAKSLAGPLAGLFAVKQVVDFAKATIDFGGHLTDLAAKTGISTDGIQKLDLAFGAAGVSLETVTGSVAKLQKNLVEGDASAVAALDKLGLSAQNLKAQKPEEAFIQVADAIGGIQNPTEKAYAAMAIFGKGGVELLAGLDGHLGETTKKFEAMGLIIDEKTVAAADEFGDALGLLGKQGMALMANVLTPFLPLLQLAAQGLMDAASAISAVLRPAVQWLTENILKLHVGFAEFLAGLADSAQRIPIIGKHLGGLSTAADYLRSTAQRSREMLDSMQDSTRNVGRAAQQSVPPLMGFGETAKKAGKEVEDAAKQFAPFRSLGTTAADAVAKSMNGGLDVLKRMALEMGTLQGAAKNLADNVKQISWKQTLDSLPKVLDAGVMPQFLTTLPATGKKAGREYGNALVEGFAEVAATIPDTLVQAFTGGGGWQGAVQALASQFVAQLGKAIGQAMGGLAGPIGAALGGLVGALFAGPDTWKIAQGNMKSFLESTFDSLEDFKAFAEKNGIDWRRVLGARGLRETQEAIDEIARALSRMDRLQSGARQFGPSKAELQQMAADAQETYAYMLESGQYTADQLAAAFRASNEAQLAALGINTQATTTHLNALQKGLDDLTAQRQSLWNSIAGEAPEEVAGVVEQGVKAQIKVLDDQILQQRLKMEQEAQLASEALESALSSIKPSAIGVPYYFYQEGPDPGWNVGWRPPEAPEPPSFANEAFDLRRPVIARVGDNPFQSESVLHASTVKDIVRAARNAGRGGGLDVTPLLEKLEDMATRVERAVAEAMRMNPIALKHALRGA